MKKCTILCLFLLFSSQWILAQQRTVTGIVKDDLGEVLPGVNIVVKNTTVGTLSGADGSFSINVPDGQSVLIFSYVGYTAQEIDVSNQTNIDVVLVAGIDLQEVVVVGYGTQQKVNLTGAVEVIDGKELTRQPVFQTSQALAGLSPGLVATQSSGRPGGDGATLRIRGIGTLGSGNNPLILVDGIPDDINGVDPNDIESISVLKDASAAAIYGSRAANGVILVTTKRGKAEQIRFNYNGWVGIQRIAQNLEFVDAIEYMENFNKAQPDAFSQDFIDEYRAGRSTDPDQYPDTDWVDEVFSEAGFQQYHSLSLNGGSEKVRVAASLSYMNQEGNIKNFEYERYNARFNTDIKVTKRFDMTFDLTMRRTFDRRPTAGLGNITRQTYRIPPLFAAINQDGTWGEGWNGTNPLGFINDGGQRKQTFSYVRAVFKATYRPIDDLSLSMTYAPQFNDERDNRFTNQYEWFSPISESSGVLPSRNSLLLINNQRFRDNFNFVANYKKTFGAHNIGALVGYEFLQVRPDNFQASRTDFILPEFPRLSNGDPETQLNESGGTPNSLVSWFGRFNYSFKDRYLFEFNLRRDASSRFAPENRVSYFPSFSLGWRIIEEGFMSNVKFLTNLKLRASWGQLGNQALNNNFPYQSVIGIGNDNFLFGGIQVIGGSQSVLANRDIQWELTETTNFGLDAGFLKNRLSLTFDYYIRTTKDILLGVTIPLSTGLNPPVQNAGEVQNKGWDLALEWKDKIGEVNYGVRFNISDVRNEITDLNGLDELPPGNTINRVGHPINSIYGYRVTGFFQSQEEVDAAPGQFGALRPGDLRYEDVNGDGDITADDRVILGNSFSRLTYGVDLYASFKGFDLSISLLGVGKREIILQGDVAYAFFNAGKIQKWQTDSWTPENTDASYPALFAGSSHNNWRTNSFWLFDASYLRVRNVTLAYNFPKSMLEKISIRNLKIYVSGQNLWTFDNMPEGIDPTFPNFTDGGFYPITSVFTLGLNVGL